ncbi:MAG: cytochrome c3 family protein [Deltaproteobacteria bacterium]|nr:cytochrome c3 family protein [Deltaproteobacteria bacterium]
MSYRLLVMKQGVVGWVGMLLAMVVFAPESYSAQSLSNEICLSCHGAPGLEKKRDGKTIPLHVDAGRFSRSVHGPLGCLSCHSGIKEIPHGPEVKRVQCGLCHAEPYKVYAQSIHGKASSKGDKDAATCDDCHGTHDIFPINNPDSRVYPLNLPRTCGVCHGDPELAKRHRIPVVNAYQLYMDSIHGRALSKSGLLVAAHCSSCHGSHEIRPKRDPESKVNRTNVPSTCGTCHAGVLAEYFGSVHGQAVKDGSAVAPVCVDCHTTHEIRRVETPLWKLEIVKECGTCHRESLRTYRDTFHGQVTTLGFIRVARCSDCHGSHRILRASDPLSSISPKNLVSTCQKCHPKANANFAQFSPHADFTDKERNPGLYYAAIFMKTLLIGVFAFFGLHTFLWLLRSTIEIWGGRKRRQATEDSDEEENKDEPPGS